LTLPLPKYKLPVAGKEAAFDTKIVVEPGIGGFTPAYMKVEIFLKERSTTVTWLVAVTAGRGGTPYSMARFCRAGP
jgi:hypothetical protein